ncbi:hypothetical protein G6F37_014260 [Rhizopus arrhizus]|nr:hypothetical protein G6F38_014148 [Rhizopus arrhizus]KAG1123006.1 hypothetical protein G6F37_014260 [Rhizopus arrhizus]
MLFEYSGGRPVSKSNNIIKVDASTESSRRRQRAKVDTWFAGRKPNQSTYPRTNSCDLDNLRGHTGVDEERSNCRLGNQVSKTISDGLKSSNRTQ